VNAKKRWKNGGKRRKRVISRNKPKDDNVNEQTIFIDIRVAEETPRRPMNIRNMISVNVLPNRECEVFEGMNILDDN
jgi:hypothetical protein